MMGRLIAFEGVRGCGKTTQAHQLASQRKCVLTSEPANSFNMDSILAGKSGAHPKSEAKALLIAADHAQHIHTLLKPALEKGEDVVCDQYIHSLLVRLEELELEDLALISDFADDGLKPDIIFWLHVPYGVSQKRMSRHNAKNTSQQHKQMMDSYWRITETDPDRWVIIDGGQPAINVTADINSVVRQRLGWFL